jgi:hypothetical protein
MHARVLRDFSITLLYASEVARKHLSAVRLGWGLATADLTSNYANARSSSAFPVNP